MKKIWVLISAAIFSASLAWSGSHDPEAMKEHFRKRADQLKKESEMLQKLKDEDAIAPEAMDNYAKTLSNLTSLYGQISSDISETGALTEELKQRIEAAETAKSDAAGEFHYQRERQRIKKDIENQKLQNQPALREVGETLLKDLQNYHEAKTALNASRKAFETAKREAWENLRKEKQKQIDAAKAELKKDRYSAESGKKEESTQSEAVFCTACGAKVSANNAFCRNCGTQLKQE